MNPRAAAFVPRVTPPHPEPPAPNPEAPAPTNDSWEDELLQQQQQQKDVPTTSSLFFVPAEAEVPHVPTVSVYIEEDDEEDEEGEETEEAAKEEVAEEIAEEIKKLEVKEVKGPEDTREHVNLVFIGHVDAGKSTISGQIMFLTGQIEERLLQKFAKEAKDQNRESWAFAYIMDTSEEERAKGKTVEVGRAHFETEKKRYTLLDAPGHKGYVPNMIGGAAQADVAVLVISARKGEFETGFEKGGQTREHARLVKTIGVKHLIVAINKMDDPTVLWSKERYDECVSKLTPFLKATGFTPKRDFQFLPLSGYTGANMKEPLKDVCPWWDGPSLLGALDQLPLFDRKTDVPLRIPVVDVFKNERGGVTLMGKVEAGILNTGQTVYMMPGKIPIEILSIENELSKLKVAKSGENIKATVRGIDESSTYTGFVVCDKDLIPVVTEFEGLMVVQELPKDKSLLTAGYEAVLHVHTLVEECLVSELVSQIDQKTNTESKKKPTFVKSGACVRARLTVSKPICIEEFTNLAQLGRFTLRDGTKTIAMGKITSVRPKAASAKK